MKPYSLRFLVHLPLILANQRSYIPMNCILRIDEVDKKGVSKITANDSAKVMPLVNPVFEGGSGKKTD